MKKSLLLLFFLCFTLVANAQIANQPMDLAICDDDYDGFAVFDLTQNDAEIFGTQDPFDFTLTLHETQADATNGINSIVNTTAYTNTVNPQSIYARLEANSNGNFDTTSFALIVGPLPPDLGPFEMLLCDDELNGSSSTDEISTFDLTIQDVSVTGGDPSINVSWFESAADEMADIPIANPTTYQNIVTPQTVIGRATTIFGCSITVPLTLTVLPNPSPNLSPIPLEVCDDNGDGFAAFNLTDKDAEIIDGEPDVTVRYYETSQDAEAGDPTQSLPSPYGNIVPFSQIVYARVTKAVPPYPVACYSIVELELIVLDGCPIIEIDPVDLFIDEGDNDGSAIFDLTLNEAQMLGSQDPSIYLFSYHESFENSIDGTNAVASPMAYQNILNPQTIYVRLTNNMNGSYALTSFLIETDGVLGVNENNFEDLNLYPNPVLENVTLQSQFLTSESTVTIFNLVGKKVFSETITPQNGRLTLEVSSLLSGVYFMRITSEANSSVKRFIKK